jgi:hypothetical protein
VGSYIFTYDGVSSSEDYKLLERAAKKFGEATFISKRFEDNSPETLSTQVVVSHYSHLNPNQIKLYIQHWFNLQFYPSKQSLKFSCCPWGLELILDEFHYKVFFRQN